MVNECFVSSTAPCPDGWKLFKNHCYKLFESPKYNWEGTRSACRSHGAHLLTIHSKVEDKFMFRSIPSYLYVVNFWMGLHRGSDSRFRWVDGKRVYYANWSKGEPDNSGDENECGGWKHPATKWAAAPCSRRQAYVCKICKYDVFLQ